MKKKKRGPKGGIKHTPGRGHDRKSKPAKTKAFKKRFRQRREEELLDAWSQWTEWLKLSDEVKKFRWELRPRVPKPDGFPEG